MKVFLYHTILALILGSTSLMSASQIAAQGSSESQLKFVELGRLGNPANVLEVKVEQSRALESGEVRVKVLATPIHPSNLLQISGNYGVDPAIPSTPGSEGVGRVVETSAEVVHLLEGQLVLLVGGGTWREEIVAPASHFIPLTDIGSPSAKTIEQLSMSVVNPLAALLMLTTFVELEAGDWLVQSASNSAVGSYLIQLAKQRGIKTVNVVRREGLADELRSMGADVVLIDGPDLTTKITNATHGAPISLAIDAVGGATFARLAESLDYGATIVSYGVMSGKPVTFSPGIAIFNDVRIRGFWLSKWFESSDLNERLAAFGQIIPLIANGSLKANVDSRFRIDEIKQAVSRAAQHGRKGKVLIVPNAN